MTNRSSALLAVTAAAFTLACGGNPEPSTPEPVIVQTTTVDTAAVQTPAQGPAATETLSDERALELARGYVELLQAGEYARIWEHVAPAAKERFGTFERFASEGQRVMEDLGAEVGIVSEGVEPPRAGMQAAKLYMRVSQYERSSGTPVRLMMGLMNDGSIIGVQIQPAE